MTWRVVVGIARSGLPGSWNPSACLAQGEGAEDLRPAVARLAGVWRLLELRETVAAWAADAQAASALRLAAIEGLGTYGMVEDRELLAGYAIIECSTGARRYVGWRGWAMTGLRHGERLVVAGRRGTAGHRGSRRLSHSS